MLNDDEMKKIVKNKKVKKLCIFTFLQKLTLFSVNFIISVFVTTHFCIVSSQITLI